MDCQCPHQVKTCLGAMETTFQVAFRCEDCGAVELATIDLETWFAFRTFQKWLAFAATAFAVNPAENLTI